MEFSATEETMELREPIMVGASSGNGSGSAPSEVINLDDGDFGDF